MSKQNKSNTRNDIVNRLQMEIEINGHIIGVAAGSGMTTRYSVKGGADFILALSAGKFRQTGRPSMASYLAYANSNDMVMDFATRELLTLMESTPILFGINATDPMIELPEYIEEIRKSGLSGLVNFPTVGLIDGRFRQALEAEGISYDGEVEAIRIASEKGMFTLAFVFDEEQAEKMIDAGADIICAHLGWTTGGALGAKKASSIKAACRSADRIFQICLEKAPDKIRMIYGGPVKTPADAEYFYKNTSCQGFIGGSSFERIPSEKAILQTTRSFKHPDDVENANSLKSVLEGKPAESEYAEYIQEYISLHYHQTITLNGMAGILHFSPPYLGSVFKKKTGCSFTEYLITFRMNKACSMLANERLSISEIARNTGYSDPAQFSRIFKKYKGMSPRVYRAALAAKKV